MPSKKLQTKLSKKPKLAVFIDAANFEISLKSNGLRVSYPLLSKWLKSTGDPTILRYYGPTFNTKGQGNFFTYIKNLGFKIITKNIKLIKAREKQTKHKANFDVEITFDAALLAKDYNTLILFSGDSDFVYLAKQLQKRGIKIIVISPQWRTARELKKQANLFIDLRNCEFVQKRAPLRGRSQRPFDRKKRITKRK